ncbi:hypothetical protein K505DRAFT_335733 [Melanomma pulvis-pyrius CBS 109.77]|uniref:RRM domain-containing protein n=1 Tax=Melanomma pulvis-pyrius CBS 109.77 TaxID=1314802 RepID=A0A6A6XHM7_9PLEO|nr:hypothetical protein K505DRAFT_335733 [Melanomma pulvis-pyrius CBS 109.77]
MSSSAMNSPTTTVYVTGLPDNAEPAFISRKFKFGQDVKDIISGGGTSAYIIFHSRADAVAFIRDINGKIHFFGERGHGHKVHVFFCASDEAKGHLRLSDFLKAQEDEPKIVSKTILISNLCNSLAARDHRVRNVKEMFLDDLENTNRNMCNEPGWEDEELVHIEVKTQNDGEALLRFNKVSTATQAVSDWNANYWKSTTIYAKCVPDEELDEILSQRAQGTADRTIKLWIYDLKPEADEDYVYRIFHPFKVNDVNIVNGKKSLSALVFMSESEATSFLLRYPDGKRGHFERRYIKVKIDSRQTGFTMPTAPSANVNNVNVTTSSLTANNTASPLFANDVRVDNLNPYATRNDVKEAFKTSGFDVSKVVLKDKFAWVGGFSSQDEAQRAVRLVNGKKIRGWGVRLSMAQK